MQRGEVLIPRKRFRPRGNDRDYAGDERGRDNRGTSRAQNFTGQE
jgi:hypothetical protein